jgi:hypothetical protein
MMEEEEEMNTHIICVLKKNVYISEKAKQKKVSQVNKLSRLTYDTFTSTVTLGSCSA